MGFIPWESREEGVMVVPPHTLLTRISDAPRKGPRGGVVIPVAVVWRTKGTGLFTNGIRVGSRWTRALYPYIKHHNGTHRYRYMALREWNKRFPESLEPATLLVKSPTFG